MMRVVFLVALLFSLCQGQDSHFELIKLTDPSAVCNDGSPAAVYYSPYNSWASKYVIHLQGGYWCWDEDSCTEREQTQPYYVSSNSYAPSMTRSTGIFSRNKTKNPDFYDASFVYVMYCSSDQYAGDTSTTINQEKWEFRGKNIVSAVVEYFAVQMGMAKSANQILWSGCSAGGQGVLNTIDQAADILAQNGYKGEFKGMADAGWMSQFVPITHNIPMGSQLALGYQLWNGSVTSCTQSNPGYESLCYLSQFGSTHLKTPTLFQCQQYDQFQTSYNCCNPPFSDDNMEYLDMMRSAYQNSYKVLGEENGIFSAACYWHCSTEDDTFTTITIKQDGEEFNLQKVLGNFFNPQENQGPTHVVDYCDGYSCSGGCPSSS